MFGCPQRFPHGTGRVGGLGQKLIQGLDHVVASGPPFGASSRRGKGSCVSRSQLQRALQPQSLPQGRVLLWRDRLVRRARQAPSRLLPRRFKRNSANSTNLTRPDQESVGDYLTRLARVVLALRAYGVNVGPWPQCGRRYACVNAACWAYPKFWDNGPKGHCSRMQTRNHDQTKNHRERRKDLRTDCPPIRPDGNRPLQVEHECECHHSTTGSHSRWYRRPELPKVRDARGRCGHS